MSLHVKDYVDYVTHPGSHSFTIDARNRIISAAAATVIAETLIAPTNVIKQRQMEYIRKQPISTRITQMPSIMQMGKSIVAESGYLGLYQGYYSILFKQIAYKSLVLFSYEPIRNQLYDWKKKYFQPSPTKEPSNLMTEMKEKIQQIQQIQHPPEPSAYVYDEYSKSALACLLSGGLSGMIGYSLVHPVEALRSPKYFTPTQTTGTTIGDQMKNVGKTTNRFWLKPNLMYVFLIYATEFGGYDYIKSYIMNHSNFATHYNISMTYLLSAAIIGAISAYISVPADILRLRSMDPIIKMKSSEGMIAHIMRQINDEGSYVFRKKTDVKYDT